MEKEIDDLEWRRCSFSPSFLHSLEGLSGVYLIWEEELKTVLYVGKGNLLKCVNNHLTNKEDSLYYAPRKKVFVIYAKVQEEYNPSSQQNGANLLRRIKVNLPTLD